MPTVAGGSSSGTINVIVTVMSLAASFDGAASSLVTAGAQDVANRVIAIRLLHISHIVSLFIFHCFHTFSHVGT